ncbi:hypothetical protein [Nocardia huaxiensis]|uniref:Pyridoxamine 5'-phosphate oxidase putative domain-containing protein n=1 Tax=Nocardia huaxiensis TaxID=2755382 RepID=A0A7D6ZI64_9NOCA|nr:hypothetical protein [Nocardia huaxiensis]QLY28503.1 hypothetical protein H0264_24435 [Nocardia huaxiensis]UFS98044.1 hypothetical protein LPY97_09170 [Nocardia huaxiensis]
MAPLAPAPGASVHPQAPTHSVSPVPANPWTAGSLWWDSKTVLVTRPIPPDRIAVAPHLVIPEEGGRLAFLLSSYTEEAQQLAGDGRVVIQPGDWRGRPALGSRQQYGTVHIITGGPFADKIREGMRIKYGARMSFARMAHRLANGAVPYGDLVAVAELRPSHPYMLTR